MTTPMPGRLPGESLESYYRRTLDRDQTRTKPTRERKISNDPWIQFYAQKIIDYVTNNPGCSENQVVQSMILFMRFSDAKRLLNSLKRRGIIYARRSDSSKYSKIEHYIETN